MNDKLSRLSFTIDAALERRLETLLKKSHYSNRSEFIRDLIRSQLVHEEWEHDEDALATVTLIYNHHIRNLNEKLTEIQHDQHKSILATTHIHLDKHLCAEMIMMRGPASLIRHLADDMRQQKGVLHSALSMSSTGKKLT